jgi:hypothetical protein
LFSLVSHYVQRVNRDSSELLSKVNEWKEDDEGRKQMSFFSTSRLAGTFALDCAIIEDYISPTHFTSPSLPMSVAISAARTLVALTSSPEGEGGAGDGRDYTDGSTDVMVLPPTIEAARRTKNIKYLLSVLDLLCPEQYAYVDVNNGGLLGSEVLWFILSQMIKCHTLLGIG